MISLSDKSSPSFICYLSMGFTNVKQMMSLLVAAALSYHFNYINKPIKYGTDRKKVKELEFCLTKIIKMLSTDQRFALGSFLKMWNLCVTVVLFLGLSSVSISVGS